MNNRRVWQYGYRTIRTVTINYQIWFAAQDVCIAAGIANYSNKVAALDADERGSYRFETNGGMQTMNTINESGLYTLLLRAHTEEAKAFKKWISSEVIPNAFKSAPASFPRAERIAEQAKLLVERRSTFTSTRPRPIFNKDLR